MVSHTFCLASGLHGVRCSIVEVVVDMLCVPSLWLLLGCVRIVLIRILYSLAAFR